MLNKWKNYNQDTKVLNKQLTFIDDKFIKKSFKKADELLNQQIECLIRLDIV